MFEMMYAKFIELDFACCPPPCGCECETEEAFMLELGNYFSTFDDYDDDDDDC